MSNSSIHQQFGLELYETNSLSDIRDPSIEKMIKMNRRNSTNLVENEDDTTIPTEEDHTSTSSTCDDDSDLSILADLLGKNTGHQNNDNKDIVDLKRQLLYNQLEMVQRQKDQLEQQSKRVAASSLATPIVAHSTSVTRPTRLVNNLHELSTIKEVDTPISERNLKINTNVANNTTATTANNNTNTNYSQWFAASRNKSSTNLTEVSSLATSSLENVTRLDESKVANRTTNSRLSPNLPSPKNYDLHDDIPVSNTKIFEIAKLINDDDDDDEYK
jgi:hypothetical protein